MTCPKCGDARAWTKCWECGWTAPNVDGPLVFELPIPTNLANARLHWTAKNRLKKAWYRGADERVDAGLVPNRPVEPLTRARVQAHFCTHNRMDRDNLAARCKWILDWLVTRGYLLDDSDQVLDWQMPSQEIDRKNKRVVVTVEAL